MSASSETVANYITAAQTAFAGDDYATARKQISLAEMELAKLPVSDQFDGQGIQYRESLANIRKAIDDAETHSRRSARRLFTMGGA